MRDTQRYGNYRRGSPMSNVWETLSWWNDETVNTIYAVKQRHSIKRKCILLITIVLNCQQNVLIFAEVLLII